MIERFKLADVVVAAQFKNEYLSRQCAKYLAAPGDTPDVYVQVTDDDIAYERAQDASLRLSDGYYESLAFYRKFSEAVASMNCILFHGSALSVHDEGYLFGAPSGTGKSTHARLYRQVYGDAVQMINDDKPLLRKQNDDFIIYGTPWDGKHHLSNNISVPLKGICFLKQGAENRIRRLSMPEAFTSCLGQVYRPGDEGILRNVLALVQALVVRIPVFEMYCTISEEAVRLSLQTMRGDLEI